MLSLSNARSYPVIAREMRWAKISPLHIDNLDENKRLNRQFKCVRFISNYQHVSYHIYWFGQESMPFRLALCKSPCHKLIKRNFITTRNWNLLEFLLNNSALLPSDRVVRAGPGSWFLRGPKRRTVLSHPCKSKIPGVKCDVAGIYWFPSFEIVEHAERWKMKMVSASTSSANLPDGRAGGYPVGRLST